MRQERPRQSPPSANGETPFDGSPALGSALLRKPLVDTIFHAFSQPEKYLRCRNRCIRPYPGLMNDSERLSRLRHDLSNPLSALLAETQLLLLNESQMDAETLTGLREIEALAIRMRTMLREL